MNFTQIPEAPDYEISPCGVVRNRLTQRNIGGHRMTTGYRGIGLIVDGKRQRFTMHRLLAKMFIPNPNNFPEVNHIDRDRANNSLSNLEWVTGSQNIRHAFTTGVSNRSPTVDYEQVPALLAAYLAGTPLKDLHEKEDRSSLRKLLKREAERQGLSEEFSVAQGKIKRTLVQRQSMKITATSGDDVLTFESINAAARYFNKNPGSIHKALKSGKQFLGYQWRSA